MPVVLVGLSYKSAPLELLESTAIPPDHSADALHALVDGEPIDEAVILSTCNRVEVYAAGPDADAAVESIRNVFVEACRVDPSTLDEGLYAHRDEAAASHLFRVAAGLDSMIVGEPEILGQVRRGLRTALAEGTAGGELSTLFDHALRTGKRVRAETELSRHAGSFATAASELLKRGLGGVADATLVVVGAGRIADATVRKLLENGARSRRVVVVGRSDERARALAEIHGARHDSLGHLAGVLADADGAVCCTAALGTVIDASTLAGRTRPLVLVDLAVPRDIDPDVRGLPGVSLHDLAALQAEVCGGAERRDEAARTAEAIVAEETDQFRLARKAAEAGPVISSLLETAEAIRQNELARARPRLSETDEEVVDQLTRRIVSNLLHAPIEAAKADGAALRDLFRLP
ncbi:MAG: glutamyl-tRNA reductase [Actinomycetota bacterium]|nr:glutamyl-tRNA reductase [Actinomycetota bacterium]